MSGFQKKLCVGGVVLAGALAYLVYAGIQSGSSYYMEVDPFLGNARFHQERVRLRGKVSPQNLVLNDEAGTVRFDLLGSSKKLSVAYDGAIPDMFEAGREVIVTGRLGSDGTFQAEELLTKCASKYESHPSDVEKSS